ncbi:hypothetical protein [Xylanimonas protaetiae]|uniref:Uncharacterized protein n=1 Tax=Xylanimonas protaetiae TaxID=2509457 RepID=A0A4P6FCY2_9MICO|nr:hypothetical protein [Xylanimonas protaetiae]QAY71417.1 hypothetical protein ET471_16410 [Xylanimonas protaetiae]
MILYLRSRRVGAAIIALGALATATILIGGRALTLAPDGVPVSMPYRAVLPLFSAALAVASLDSPVPQIDRTDTGPLQRVRHLHLLAALTVTLGLSALTELFTATGAPALAVRGSLCWFGLALISGVVIRMSFAWVIPLVALAPLIRWGWTTEGPEAWNWAAAPSSDLDSWLLAVGAICLGGIAWMRSTTRRGGPRFTGPRQPRLAVESAAVVR